MRIALGADHAGYRLKETIKQLLQQLGHEPVDFGTGIEQSCDYPDFARQVAETVARGEADGGILVCGTGIGMSIAANKVPGIRAAVCSEPLSARLARLHNNANILALGGRLVGPLLAEEIVRAWLETDFEGGRHQRRLDKVAQLDSGRLP